MKTSIMPGIRRLRRGRPVRPSKKRKKNPAKGESKPQAENFVHYSEDYLSKQKVREFKNKFDPFMIYKGKLRSDRRCAPSSTKKRPRSPRPTPRTQTDPGLSPTVTCEECCCQPRVAQAMSYEEYEIFINSSEELPNKEAIFPNWVKIMSAENSENPPEDSLCFMTEIQLQAILDNQVGQDGELDVDMTTNEAGEKISKFDIKAISLGEKVPPK
jgi:hypothetical protein